MNKLTSFTHFVTAEGGRIAFTYSTISPEGEIESQNNKRNFIAVDEKVQDAVKTICDYIEKNKLGGD